MNITVNEGKISGGLESVATNRHLVCWRSTIAGFFISAMTFAGIISLAVAFGGIGLSDGSTLENATVFSVLTFIFAVIASVFAGSYFSVRLARFQSHTVGAAQGLVVAAVSIVAAIWLAVATVGTIGKAVGQMTGVATQQVALDAQNPMVVDFVEDNIGTTRLKSAPSFVAVGLARRLIRNDIEGSRNFLIRHSSLSFAEAETRIGVLSQRMYDFMNAARDNSAKAMMGSGWSLFLMVALAAIAAALGGLLGSIMNIRQTLDVIEPAYISKQNRVTGVFQPAR